MHWPFEFQGNNDTKTKSGKESVQNLVRKQKRHIPAPALPEVDVLNA